ncbi:hypothetical protein DFH27DRAFT_570390 [Peziza echinospora]|nr:hypothetical protein DFH27DRAFT_570390 [Peziza echinospora]
MEHAPSLPAAPPAPAAGPGASKRDPGGRPRHPEKGTDADGQKKENGPLKRRVRFTDMEEDAGPLLFNARDSMYMRAELQREWDFGIPAQDEAHRYARWFAEEMKREAAEQAAMEAEEGIESTGPKNAYAKADKAVHPNRLSTDLSGLDLDLKNLGDDVSGLDVFSRVEVALGKQKEAKAEKKRKEKAEKEKSRHKSSSSISMALSPKRADSADSVLLHGKDPGSGKEKKGSRFLRKVITDRIVVKDKDKSVIDDKKSRDIADFIGGLAKQAQSQAPPADAQSQLRPTVSNSSSRHETSSRPLSPPQPLPQARDRITDAAQKVARKPAAVDMNSDWGTPPGSSMTKSPSSISDAKRPSPPLPPDQPTRRPVPSTAPSAPSIMLVNSQKPPQLSALPVNEERKSRAHRSESTPPVRTHSPYSQEASEERRPSAPNINYYQSQLAPESQYQQASSQRSPQQQRSKPERANSQTPSDQNQYQSRQQPPQPPAPPPPQQRQSQAPPPAAPPPQPSSSSSRQSRSEPPLLAPNNNSMNGRLPLPGASSSSLASSVNGSRQPSPSPTPHNQPPAPPPPTQQQQQASPPPRVTNSEDMFSRIEQELANSAVADSGHHGKGRKFLGKAFGHVKEGVAKAKAKSGK